MESVILAPPGGSLQVHRPLSGRKALLTSLHRILSASFTFSARSPNFLKFKGVEMVIVFVLQVGSKAPGNF